MENQPAWTIARDHDPIGTRTIGEQLPYFLMFLTLGVLTKADLLQEEDAEKWLNILKGKSYQLTHGYFVTRLPSTKETDSTWEQVREREEKFFQSHKRWNHLDQWRSRFGHQNLVRTLSDLLCERIDEA